MIDSAIGGISPPAVGVFRAEHDAGLIFGQLRATRVRHRHRVFALLGDGAEFGSLREDDGGHGVAGFDFEGSAVDASVKRAAFSQSIWISAIGTAAAVGDRAAIRAADIVRRLGPVIAGRFGLESALATDEVVVATFAGFRVVIIGILANAVELPAVDAFHVFLASGRVDESERAR